MATFTLTRPDLFVPGTTVRAYPLANWPAARPPQPGDSPTGLSASSVTAGAASTTFSGLTEGVTYVAATQLAGAWVYVRFTVASSSTSTGGGPTPVPSVSDSGVFRVKEDYGAPWNGTDDDIVAVQAAVNAAVAANRGATIQLPEGTGVWSAVAGSVTIPPNLSHPLVIRGRGRGVTTIKLTATAFRAFDPPWSVATGDTIGNVTFEDLTVDCNGQANGNVGDHVLYGTLKLGSLIGQVNITNVKVQRVDMINVPNAGGSQQGRRGIALDVWHGDINLPQNTITKIRIRDVTQDGGNYLTAVMAQSPQAMPANVYHDDIEIENVRFTNSGKPVATYFTFASAVHIGSAGWGKRVSVKNVYCEGSGDNAVEIDNLTQVHVRDVLAVDTFSPGTLVSNFVAAGDSYPATSKLNGATIVGATVLTVDDTTGWAAGDRIIVGRADTTAQEVRTIATVDSSTQITLTAALGLAYADRSIIYRVGNIQGQRFRLENIVGRRTSTANSGAILVQNVSNPTPIGHIEIDGLGWYSKGATMAAQAQGELIKCQTGSTNSPTGNPLSLTVRGMRIRNEGAISQSSGTSTVSPIYLIMRGPQCRVIFSDLNSYWQGAIAGSGTITFVGLETATAAIDLDVDGWTSELSIPTSSVASKVADFNSNGQGGMSWRVRGLIAKASDGSGQPRGIVIRRGSAYSSNALRPAITANQAIGDTTLTFASTAGFAAGQKIVVGAESTTTSEIHTIKSLTGTVITLAASTGLVTARTSGTSLVAPLNQMALTDSDLTGLGVAGLATLASDANVLAGARMQNVITPKPIVPATVTLPATGVEGTIADGYDGELWLNGGSVTLIEWSGDGGANWFTSLTQAAAAVNHRMRIRSGEHYRVTYGSAPTAKRVVPSR